MSQSHNNEPMALVRNRGGVSSIDERFLRLPAVIAQTGLARSTIYLHIKNGAFPAPVKLGGNAVAWLSSEVSAWMADCVAHRNRAA